MKERPGHGPLLLLRLTEGRGDVMIGKSLQKCVNLHDFIWKKPDVNKSLHAFFRKKLPCKLLFTGISEKTGPL